MVKEAFVLDTQRVYTAVRAVEGIMTDDSREQLFDGESMDGWEMVGRGGFRVEDGLLVTEGGMGLLWNTTRTVGNATLRVVYKVSRPEDNSGVFVRIGERPDNVWYPVHHGYEVQIMATDDEYHRTGGIYSLTKSPEGVQYGPRRVEHDGHHHERPAYRRRAKRHGDDALRPER